MILDTYGYRADHEFIRAALGLTAKAKLPVEGMPPRMIQGYEVWVNPLGPNKTGHKRSTHRVLARCNCGKVLSVGRLHQHKCRNTYTTVVKADE